VGKYHKDNISNSSVDHKINDNIIMKKKNIGTFTVISVEPEVKKIINPMVIKKSLDKITILVGKILTAEGTNIFEEAFNAYSIAMQTAVEWSSKLVISSIAGYESEEAECSKNANKITSDHRAGFFYPVQYKKGIGYDSYINLTSSRNFMKFFNSGVVICMKKERLDDISQILTEITSKTVTSENERICPNKDGHFVQILVFGHALTFHCAYFRKFKKDEISKKYIYAKNAITHIQAISGSCSQPYMADEGEFNCICNNSDSNFGNLNTKVSSFEIYSKSVYICAAQSYNKDFRKLKKHK